MNREQAALAGYADRWPTPPVGAQDAADLARTQVSGRDVAPEGAVLRLLARTSRARAAVTATTLGGAMPLWILQGMPTDGALTCVDDEARAALTRRATTSAGVPQHRWRIMPGRPGEVMNRLRDAAYDLVVVDATAPDLAEQVSQAQRIVRPGGLLVMVGVGLDGRLADPADRSDDTVLVRTVLEEWRAMDSDAMILPMGAGVAAAVVP
ncbi:O-methyltransferase [Kytococcus sp. Marseille-QA3725]